MTVLEQARALRAEAVAHKRASNRERKAAQQKMELLRLLCAKHGINFEVIVREDKDDGTGTNHR